MGDSLVECMRMCVCMCMCMCVCVSFVGELAIPEEELTDMMQQMEAAAHSEITRLQAKKADVEAQAAAELHKVRSLGPSC